MEGGVRGTGVSCELVLASTGGTTHTVDLERTQERGTIAAFACRNYERFCSYLTMLFSD